MVKPKQYRVLSSNERVRINLGLNDGKGFAEIAHELGRSVSTISREVNNNSTIKMNERNSCQFYNAGCSKRGICDNGCTTKLCYRCRRGHCWDHCADYSEALCERLCESPTGVCNGCELINDPRCRYNRKVYEASEAENKAFETRHNKSSGFDLTMQQLKIIDKIISPLVINGQSPYAALVASKDKLEARGISLSKSRLYRLIDKEMLSCRNGDLHERVKRRKPKVKRRLHNEETRLSLKKAGHMWDDYQKYIKTHDVMVVQMDCVEGLKTDQKTLLTLHWALPHFQIAKLMDSHDSDSVVKALDDIEEALGYDLFCQMFPLILTDNGHEFTDIDGMEHSCTQPDKKRTMVFFCEPNRSDQKGAAERNHREMRKIIPKRKFSFDDFSQDDITLVINNVNSYVRESLCDMSPFDWIDGKFPQAFLEALGLYRIPVDEVVMKPKLLSHIKQISLL